MAAGALVRGCPRNPLTLCLITDRQRLLAVTGRPSTEWGQLLRAQIEGAVAGGVDVVQIREPGLEAVEVARLVRDCMAIVRAARTHVIVNDRLDIAVVCGAHGVHLREDSIPIAAARQLGGRGFLVGRSAHSSTTAARAQFADYLIVGSVFETASKPGQAASLGLEGLREVVRQAVGCPIWAVGGVTAERARQLVTCGVQGAAAIGAFLPAANSRSIAADVKKATEGLRFSFDSVAELP